MRITKATTPLVVLLCMLGTALSDEPPQLEQSANTWVKRSPLPGGPPSPMLGYEGSFGYDPVRKLLIRWAGHNQGGGGEQNAETWTFDPATSVWTLKEPNLSPPGVCCAQQNVFDPVGGRFLRFQAFSGSHGWQWFREIYMNNTSVWSYDLGRNTWRDMRAHPAPRTAPLRCAAWDSEHQVVVIFGGEGSRDGTVVYDPYTNTWTRMNPPIEPDQRSGGNMAYDAALRQHILFGSQFANDVHTWAYNLRRNLWTDLRPATMPPTDRNDPVLAYDAANRVVVCVLQRTGKSGGGDEAASGLHETWVYDAAGNDWRKMNPPQEPQGRGNRRRIMAAIPDQNVILLESYINPATRIPGIDREQQIWTYRFAASQPRVLAPPAAVQVVTQSDCATIRWAAQPKAAGYTLFAADADLPWQAEFRQLAKLPNNQTEYEDHTLRPGTLRFYYVCAGDAEGNLSEPSVKVRTQPALVEELVVSAQSATEAHLAWATPSAADVAGFYVERAVVEPFSEDQIERLRKDTPPLVEPSVGAFEAIGPFTRLTVEPTTDHTYVDRSIDLSQPATIQGEPVMTHRFSDKIHQEGNRYRFAIYAYRVRAVNKLGVVSGPGPLAFTIPSSPQWVFAKEEGSTCQLKWAANPEQQIQGYRVYRMEPPRINGPGQPTTRVTPKPVGDTQFADPEAGDATRRYWIVAVDRLGQEGFPSAPVWHRRQYRRVYERFTGEWHQ